MVRQQNYKLHYTLYDYKHAHAPIHPFCPCSINIVSKELYSLLPINYVVLFLKLWMCVFYVWVCNGLGNLLIICTHDM